MRQRRLSGCAAVVLAVGCLFLAAGEAQASSAHLGLAASSGARSVVGIARTYIYKITRHDGSQSIRIISGDKINDVKKSLREDYAEALKEWNKARREWMKIERRMRYPVPKPASATAKRVAKLPDDDDKLAKILKRLRDKLEVWNVCIVKAMDGSRTAEAIRRDKMLRAKTKLLTEYAEAALEFSQARKEDPDGMKGAKSPGRPVISVRKPVERSAEAADRRVAKLSARLNPDEKDDD